MPDNNNSRDPWDRSRHDGPPDLLALIKKFFSSKSSGSDSGSSGGAPVSSASVARWVMYTFGAIILLWILFGIFVVKPAQEAVVQRFGRYLATEQPGVHWAPPLMDRVTVLNTQQVSNFTYEAEMLTRDENIVSIKLAVQYRIVDPEHYLFHSVQPEIILRQVVSSALRQSIGHMTLDDILTTEQVALIDHVKQQADVLLDGYKVGLGVEDISLQQATAPEQVASAIHDVVAAGEDKQRYLNQARATSQKILAKANAKVAQLVQSAIAYKKSIVAEAKGRVLRYLAVLKPYQASPKVTRQRLYLDAVSTVLSRTTNIVVDSSGQNVLYLPLDQILKKQSATTSKSENTDSLDATDATGDYS